MTQTSAVQKSPEAFRTISEVAAELDVPQHVLRFWETRFSQVKPLKRGGGRRYYRPDDVDLLRGICALLYREGLTIKGVQKILREQGARAVMDVGRGAVRLIETARGAPKPARAPAQESFPSDVYPNVRRFAPEPNAEAVPQTPGAAAAALSADERAHFEVVLEELLALKERLRQSRARCGD